MSNSEPACGRTYAITGLEELWREPMGRIILALSPAADSIAEVSFAQGFGLIALAQLRPSGKQCLLWVSARGSRSSAGCRFGHNDSSQ